MQGDNRRRGGARRACLLALLAGVVCLLALPGAALAAQQIISSTGPLSQIFINDDLGCQTQHVGDQAPSFYGGTNPGSCGTFLAIPAAAAPGVLYGPASVPPTGTTFTPVSQTLTGSGTSASPYTVTTTVSAGASATIVETDSYVVGQEQYTTSIQVTNTSGAAYAANTTLYHAGDCFLSSLDTGYGALVSGGPECTQSANDSPPVRHMGLQPQTAGANYVEGAFGTVWSEITSAGAALPDTVDATVNQDNGMGLSWSLAGQANGATSTFTFLNTFSPSVLPTSAPAVPLSAGNAVCSPNGLPVHVNAPLGPQGVNYIIDGGPQQIVPVDAAGNATIPLHAGKNSVEFWAVDAQGNQESPHHFHDAAPESGPTLTIISDQHMNSYELGDAATVDIAAGGAGLSADPSAMNVPLATNAPGTFSLQRTATDICGSTTTTYTYTVLPPPTLGKTVNVEPTSGTVLVKVPGGAASAASLGSPWAANISLAKGTGFIPLAQARQIPVGSILDTTKGTVRLTSATTTKAVQVGTFQSGIFQELQSRAQRGLVTLNLINTSSQKKVCASVGKKKAGTRASIARKLSSKVLGLLLGNAKGHYVTRGQFSAATVRGTQWGVRNRCDGTLTVVKRGSVVVRDFRLRRNITLTAGKSYLAKP
jgi:hypothetical protein